MYRIWSRQLLRIRFAELVGAAVMLVASNAWAQGLCGDDVGGTRVACQCGSVVVSDTTLRADDPVVLERCPGDGLLVRAPASAESLVLNLAGQSLLGTGSGSGIRVVAGGQQGVVIDGGTGAVVAGFSTGLRATGKRSVREVRAVAFNANTYDGVALWTLETQLTDVTADGNGRDGLRVGGRQSQVEGARAERNGRYGVRVSGANAAVDASGKHNRRGDLKADPRSGVEQK